MPLESPRKKRRLDATDNMYSFAPAASPLRPSIGAKKLVVVNLKQHVWDHKAYFERSWKRLSEGLDSIFRLEEVNKEELYRLVENLCRQGDASKLYNRLEERLVPQVSVDLKGAMETWGKWKKCMLVVNQVFYFLDRSYLLHSKATLAEVTIALFRRALPDLMDDAAEVLRRDRAEGTDELQEVLVMFKELGIDFEERLLLETRSYLNFPADVPTVQGVITREMERFKSQRLLDLLEEELISKRVNEYLDIEQELDSKDLPALQARYELLQRRKLGSRLRPPFEKWVVASGTKIVLGEAEKMVQSLLEFQRYCDSVLTAFGRDESLGHGLRESFEVFMNKTKKGDSTWGTDNTKVGEMIAKYVDQLLRKGEDEEPMEDQLDQVLDLFRFVHGKAVFEAFYKKDLAKRLLMGRSASADAELAMLARLKTECGSSFTANLEQMFKDIELGKQDRFDDKALQVHVLSSAAWPSYPDVPVNVPRGVLSSLERFERHYKQKHSGRKIQWKHSLAHCQMKAVFPQGVKELVVSSFQAVVLLLFNNGERLSYGHILEETGLPPEEVKRTLQSLACAKLRPLSKHPPGREIGLEDEFTVADFNPPRYRVKINQIQLRETQQENKETHIRVAEDRNFECQAAIVRIMKGRQKIGHGELVAEVIKATMSRGVLAVADIKKNIDRLIEKDYMEREDGGGYAYVA